MVIKKKGRKGKKNRSTREERKREGTGQKCRLGRERKGKVEWRVTGQLADRPTRGQPSRGQAYSRTSQLADNASRTQDYSHTGQLAHESARRQ